MKEEKSPFKFLDPYTKNDKDIFFGRNTEIDQLYKMVFETDLILVYGESGTGKTSLIQCGLANRFLPADWKDIYIRRNDNINQSLWEALDKNAKTPIPPYTPFEKDLKKDSPHPIVKAVESVFLDHFKPIFLIFDQFEELFTFKSIASKPKKRKKEQEAFIHAIAHLLNAKLQCKVILIMREEYLAQLYDFEKVIPTLFDKRIRIERMTTTKIKEVIHNTLMSNSPQIKGKVALLTPEKTVDEIVKKITDERGRIQLPFLQIYLHHLYQVGLLKQKKETLKT